MKSLQSVLLLIACVLPCAAQSSSRPGADARVPELNPQAWQEFTSADGGFAIRMPAKPVEARRQLPPPNQNVTMHTFIASTMGEYGVVYADYPWPIEGTERVGPFFDGVVNMGVQGIGGKLLELREQDYRGHPGRVYLAEFGGGYHIRARAFVVKNRLYMVTASTFGSKAPSPIVAQLYEDAAEAYLDSFKLTSDGGAVGGVSGVESDVQKAVTPTTPADGEVDRLLKQSKQRDELVLGVCLEGADCKSIKGEVVDGHVIKGELVAGKVISKQAAVYPPIAKAARAQGAVVVQIVVDGEGKVIAAQAVSGHPLLQAAAVKAVRGWLFSPSTLDGKPVKVMGTVTVTFTLQ